MPLRVAPCPSCQRPLVFGERSCRTCGQAFNYGARNPPEPTFAQLVEALRAAGHAPPSLDDAVPHTAPQNAAYRGAPVAPAPHPRSIVSGAPVMDPPAPAIPTITGLESGRFERVGEVQVDDIPGFIDSTLYAAFTPKQVNTAPVAGLDTGRAVEVGQVRVAPLQGVEATAKDAVGEVPVEDIPGLFHSDFLRAPNVPLHTQAVEGLETSRRAEPAPGATAAPGKRQRNTDDLDNCTCSCGTTHHLPRCPSCGTPHRGAGG